MGSSCIDKGLDIFNSNQNKKGGGVLNKRIKQKQMDQVPPPYDDAAPMVPVVIGGETQPQGKDRLTTVLGSAVIGGEKEIPVSET